MFVVVVLVLVLISAPHSSAGTTAPDAMRVERAGTQTMQVREVDQTSILVAPGQSSAPGGIQRGPSTVSPADEMLKNKLRSC